MIQGITALGFIILFALYSDSCLPAVAESINVFLTRILPSIFPFYVASNILMNSPLYKKAAGGLTPVLKKVFGLSGNSCIAILVGAISGYPAGAKVTADLYKSGLITRKEAYALSAFTNNCSPLFLIGVVGTGLLGSGKTGIYLWLIHITAAFFTGLIFRCKSSATPDLIVKFQHQGLSPHKKQNLPKCISDAMMSMIPIAATVIFFSSLIAVLEAMSIIPEGLSPLTGILEITHGITSVIRTTGVSQIVKLTLISALAGWAGISVHIQVAGILSDAGLSIKKYLLGKICQTAIAVILTLSFFCFHPIL